jgi:hypothetical protein
MKAAVVSSFDTAPRPDAAGTVQRIVITPQN